MKFLNLLLIAVLIFSGSFTTGYAQAISADDSLISNPGLESGKVKWTASVASTFTTTIVTADVGAGKVSGQLTCTAIGQFVETALTAVPNVNRGGACLANMKYKNGVGVKIQVRDASVSLTEYALTTSTSWVDVDKDLNFVCPTSGVKVRLECTAANGSVAFDEVKVQENRKLTIVEESSPVGTVIASMLTETQFQGQRGTHWVLADGRTATGSKFATLFGSAIVPDLRGTFLRGKNNGVSTAIGNAAGEINLGVYQADANKFHTHVINAAQETNSGGSDHISSSTPGGIAYTYNTGSSGGTEANPRNVTVNYFIKINDVSGIKTFTDSGYALRAGQIISGAFAVCPAGSLEANGIPVSRNVFPDLFQAIGVTHGDGTKLADGVTNSAFTAGLGFNVPNFLGRFLRGHANGSTNDPDRASRAASNVGGATGDAVGSVQTNANFSHTHSYTTARGTNGQAADYTGFHNPTYFSPSPNTSGGPANVASITIVAHNGLGSNGAGDSRPNNANVKFCIQTKDTNIVGSFQQFTDQFNVKAITTSYTATTSDATITHSGAASTLTLPAASLVPGKIYNIVSIGGNALTITPTGVETIDGRTTFIVAGGSAYRDSVAIQSTGTGWIFLNDTGVRKLGCYVNSNATVNSSSEMCDVWISSLTRPTTGTTTKTLKTGIFQTLPVCTASALTQTFGRFIEVAVNSTTQVVTEANAGNDSLVDGIPYYIQCIGRR